MGNEKVSGTCQACFGAFAVKSTSGIESQLEMVHHGYKRPGNGYIVGDCWGVGKKPYELDVKVTQAWHQQLVGKVLPGLRLHLQSTKDATELSTSKTDY